MKRLKKKKANEKLKEACASDYINIKISIRSIKLIAILFLILIAILIAHNAFPTPFIIHIILKYTSFFVTTLTIIIVILTFIFLVCPKINIKLTQKVIYTLLRVSIIIIIVFPITGTALEIIDENNNPPVMSSEQPEQLLEPNDQPFNFDKPEPIGGDAIKTVFAMIYTLNNFSFEYPVIDDSIRIDISKSLSLCTLLPNLLDKHNISYNTVKHAIFSPGGIYSRARQNYREKGRAVMEQWIDDLKNIINASIELIDILKLNGIADHDLHRQLALRYMEFSDIYNESYENATKEAINGINQYFQAIKIAQKSGESSDELRRLFNDAKLILERLTNNQKLGKLLKDNEKSTYTKYKILQNSIDLMVIDKNISKIEQKFPITND